MKEFSDDQYEFSKHDYQDMPQTAQLGRKRDNFPKAKLIQTI
jgi:hypothetical protein